MSAQLLADAKLETLVKKLAEKQYQKDAGERREDYLIDKLQLMRKEVEQFDRVI